MKYGNKKSGSSCITSKDQFDAATKNAKGHSKGNSAKKMAGNKK